MLVKISNNLIQCHSKSRSFSTSLNQICSLKLGFCSLLQQTLWIVINTFVFLQWWRPGKWSKLLLLLTSKAWNIKQRNYFGWQRQSFPFCDNRPVLLAILQENFEKSVSLTFHACFIYLNLLPFSTKTWTIIFLCVLARWGAGDGAIFRGMNVFFLTPIDYEEFHFCWVIAGFQCHAIQNRSK